MTTIVINIDKKFETESEILNCLADILIKKASKLVETKTPATTSFYNDDDILNVKYNFN